MNELSPKINLEAEHEEDQEIYVEEDFIEKLREMAKKQKTEKETKELIKALGKTNPDSFVDKFGYTSNELDEISNNFEFEVIDEDDN